mmetsp:Transcript_41213/g.104815  ORF Transcript_41213/g.104815 Transcript_41213/m.104815 type:complete len:262 (-) Transcript_41213:73-858(-)
MPLQVTKLGGGEVEVTVEVGRPVKELRSEVAEKLGVDAACVGLAHGSTNLADEDPVPDGVVNVLVSKLAWIDDGTGRIEDMGGGHCRIGGGAGKGDTKFNAMCDVALTDGEQYFEVEVCSGTGPFIGIATKKSFGPGYKLKGAFLGGPGNLADGGALLRGGFSKEVVQGAVIGVQLDLKTEDSVGMTFWHDGRCLGPGILASRPAGEAVYPVVSARSAGDAFTLRLCPPPGPEAVAAAEAAHHLLVDNMASGKKRPIDCLL